MLRTYLGYISELRKMASGMPTTQTSNKTIRRLAMGTPRFFPSCSTGPSHR